MPKVLRSDPKGLQNGALDGHFDNFFCKKPTLHLTAYLLCFRHILEVLGSQVLSKFQLKMCVGSRSPPKAVTLSLFLIFRRKCVKMGAQMGGGKVRKMCFFVLFYSLVPLWVPLASFSFNFGLPGHHFGTFLGEMSPQTNLAAARWRGWPPGNWYILDLEAGSAERRLRVRTRARHRFPSKTTDLLKEFSDFL